MNGPFIVVATGAALLWAAESAPSQSEPRLPVPDAAAQKEAEKLLQDIFKEEYAKRSASDKAALAGKMLAQAREVKDDPTSKFVLYREAQSLYASAGDIENAAAGIEELAKLYVVDALAMKAAALAAAAKVVKTPDEWARLGSAQLKLASEAASADQYDAADKAVQAAAAAAKKAGSAALAANAAAKSKEVSELKARQEKIRRARETLKNNPGDAAANQLVGLIEAGKGNWSEALPLLARASEVPLRTAAKGDLAAPTGEPERVAVGDAWWELAEKDTGPARDAFRSRAFFWYEQVFEKLTGLTKAKLEKRVVEMRRERLLRGTWVDVSDPRFYGRSQAPLEVGETAQALLDPFPAGPFDGISVRVRGTTELFSVSVQFEPRKRDMEVSTITEKFLVATMNASNRWIKDAEASCPKKGEYILAMILLDGQYVFHVDGKEMLRQKATADSLPGLRLFVFKGTVTFDQIKLRRREER